MNQNIFTLHPDKRNGFRVNRRRYEVMREYILSTLRRDGDVSLDALLEEAKNEFKVGFDGNASWYVLVVKLDLEARGVIESTIVLFPVRGQLIKMKRQKRGMTNTGAIE